MIRFQLEQLGAKNAHHEFEHLCRHFSREMICPNILPATGPVSAGGDQGRDFETFASFINQPRKDGNYFGGKVESKRLIFACSLVKKAKLRSKIESDVASICNGCKPDIVYFFSNQDVPVALRHTLQSWCMATYSVQLEIIDAQALSEQLSLPSTFWVAEKYLDIPSEFMSRPVKLENQDYEEARQRWVVEARKPVNYADFVDIKASLRRVTFDDVLKSDISAWQRVMEAFISKEGLNDLQRRATYEVCVAELRGKHDLTPRLAQVEEYFERWGSVNENGAIRDTVTLLSYCSTAVLIGELTIEKEKLHTWTVALIKKIHAMLSAAVSDNSKAELLMIRAQAATLPFQRGNDPVVPLDHVFKWCFRLVETVKKAPLFPLEPFADILTEMAPYLGGHLQYADLTSCVDDLLAERTKGYIVAEKCRDRAIKFIDAGFPILAISEFHRSKVNWFSGDTLKGSLLSSLMLSNIYLDIGLGYAAKYHAMAALFVINSSEQDDIKKMMRLALSQLGRCHYSCGDWISYSELFPLILAWHYQQALDPDDWIKHEEIQEAAFHFLVMRALARASGTTELVDLVEQPLCQLSMPEDLRNEILSPSLSTASYESMSAEQIIQKCSEVLSGPPFADSDSTRSYRWRALGVTWVVRSTNLLADASYVEEFVAVLQIAIADFARIDLGLLPTTVELHVSVTDSSSFHFGDASDNERLAFDVELPRSTSVDISVISETQHKILSVATSLLVWCSSLPEKEVKKKLDAAFTADLSGKAFLLRPYWALFQSFNSVEDFDLRRKTPIPLFDAAPFNYHEHEALSWIDAPGWGYTKAKAHEFLENRYRRSVIPICKTLNKLKTSERFKCWVEERRSEGLLDWQILAIISNMAINLRAGPIRPMSHSDLQLHKKMMMNLMDMEEPDNFEFPEEILYSDYQHVEKINMITNARIWGLVGRSQTPDFAAWSRLLNVRYFQSSDDIPHDNIFQE